MSEKKTIDKNVEVVGKSKTSVSIETPERICDARCKICNSQHLKAIHDLKRAGHTFDKIVKIAKNELHFDISPAGLSRHFVKYQKRKDIISAQLINDNLIEEATCQAVHTKNLVRLIDEAFKTIRHRIDSGTINLDIGDLEKLMKLRYQVMDGQSDDENDILAIFQKASNKYGLNLQQGVLFKTDVGSDKRAD